MKEKLQLALVDTLEYLMSLVRESIPLEEANTGLRLLQKQHPDIKMDLLWEEEAYDYSVHYDTLLHLCGEGTVSLSFCPERTLPWPMRGVHHSKEQDLIRVNNTVLTVGEAIAYLDFIWDEVPLVKRLVNVCLIREALEKDPIDISDAELQRAMDSFRKVHKLHRAEDTHRWMEQQGMTHEKLERLIANQAMVAKLRDQIAADHVQDYFKEHQTDFDTAYIARFVIDNEQSAYRTYEQLRKGELDFYESVQRHFLAMVKRTGHRSRDIFSVVQRRQTPSYLGEAVFVATPGEVLGPVYTDEGYAIIRVLSFVPAQLDKSTCNIIKSILFEEWLSKRRQTAKIEWYWG